MDNRHYLSETVRAWCERFHVCPQGRDLAAGCRDLDTVWWNIDRPGWLLWFLAMGTFNDPDRWSQYLPDLVWDFEPDLFEKIQRLNPPNPFPPGWISCQEVDAEWCDRIRAAVDCPFIECDDAFPGDSSKVVQPVPVTFPAAMGDDGSVVVQPVTPAAQAAPDAPPATNERPVDIVMHRNQAGETVRISVDGLIYLPVSEAQAAIAHHASSAFEFRRLYRWVVAGVVLGGIAAVAMAAVVRREGRP